MQALPFLGRRPRLGDALIVAAVVAIAIAAVVNGVSQVRNNHGTKRDIATFDSYLTSNGGRAGYGNPRVRLHSKLDSVCATHRLPEYRVCLDMTSAHGKIVDVYEIVRDPAGGSRRVPFNPARAGSSSAAPRSTQTG